MIKSLNNRILACLILALMASGCATASGRRQIVSIDSEPRGATVYLQGEPEALGQTPFFYRMERTPEDTFVFQAPSGAKVAHKFSCNYRWWLEGLGNGTLLLFSPEAAVAAFALDYITGAAFECPLNITAAIPQASPSPFRSSYCKKYLILPPFHFDEQISDEIAQIWQQEALYGLKGCDNFFDYELGKRTFQSLNLSHRNAVGLRDMRREQINYAGLATGATDLVVLNYEQVGGALRLKADVIDLHTGQSRVVDKFAVQVNGAQRFEIDETDSYLLYTFRFIPNSVTYGFSRTSQLMAAREGRELTSVVDEKGLPSYIANWNMISVEHPDAYSSWDVSFDFYPSLSFVYKNQDMEFSETETDRQQSRRHQLFHILPLYNISLTGHTALGAFTVAIGAGVSQHYLKATNKSAFYSFNATFMNEIAWSAFVSQDLFFRFATGEYRFYGRQYRDELYKVTPRVNFVSAGVGFFIPQFRRFARSFY